MIILIKIMIMRFMIKMVRKVTLMITQICISYNADALLNISYNAVCKLA